MNMQSAVQALSNPQSVLMQYAIQGMIAQHPKEWKEACSMLEGKTRQQQMSILKDMYKQKGMSLEDTAKQWGISI